MVPSSVADSDSTPVSRQESYLIFLEWIAPLIIRPNRKSAEWQRALDQAGCAAHWSDDANARGVVAFILVVGD